MKRRGLFGMFCSAPIVAAAVSKSVPDNMLESRRMIQSQTPMPKTVLLADYRDGLHFEGCSLSQINERDVLVDGEPVTLAFYIQMFADGTGIVKTRDVFGDGKVYAAVGVHKLPIDVLPLPEWIESDGTLFFRTLKGRITFRMRER